MFVRLAIILPFYLALAVLMLAAGPGAGGAAAAGRISLPGITFSEASSNFRLLAASGTGSLEDPIVLVEEVFGEGEVVLAINVEAADFGSRVATRHAVGFALQKVVINRTALIWDYYALELEFEAGRGSDYYDGLSFAQSEAANRPFRSDSFAQVDDLTEPRDVIRFSQGQIIPGERGRFAVAITHTGIKPNFFLVQHVRPPYAQLDVPTYPDHLQNAL
ncbi:MAG: hypothetical protein ISR50_09205 [Alphaproteobacteria bacterium]|nr:hypothetical protein [Alphaproteobacteria bacterium]MBL6952799.1 hypothetical protein [Alphaproteobacteria bacterium]